MLLRSALIPTFMLLVLWPPVALAALCTSSLPFQAQSNVPTTHQPVEIAVADFNGDGVPDLAVTNSYLDGSGLGSVSIFISETRDGAATNRFLPRTDFSVGGQPLGIVAADFNSDGIMDLAVGNWGSNAVTVLLGLGSGGVGNGTFGSPANFPAGNRPYELVATDFNGDGIIDLAVCDNGESAVKVLIGQGSAGHGNGTFAAAASYALSQTSTALAAGDVNGDGITDLVVTENFAGTVAVLIGQGIGGVGDGSFSVTSHLAVGPEPYDVALGDFNHDGRLDIVCTRGTNSGIGVMLGLGDGDFSTMSVYAPDVTVGGIAIADFDQDGISDLVITSSVGNQLLTLQGLGSGGAGDGTFAAPAVIADCCFPVHPVAADLNGNGLADVISANFGSNSVGVFLDACALNPAAPILTRVRDVPNDQGGKLFLTWLASSLDVTGGPVDGYRVWREIPPGVASARAVPAATSPLAPLRTTRVTRPDGTTDVIYWEALATLPAQRLQGYGYTAATPQDSMAGSNPYSVFFITATTSNIDVFYDSNPDSGYSVDNLAPATPSPFTAQYSSSGVALHWSMNHESDLAGYRLYRGTDPSFMPSPATLISAQPDTGYFDPSGTGFNVYKLTATDVHGNASPYATVELSVPTAVEISLTHVEATADQVALTWYVAGGGSVASVERSVDQATWSLLAQVGADGTGRIDYIDRAVTAGASYRYRLVVDQGAGEVTGGEALVQIPAPELSLAGLQPNPLVSGARFVVAFALPSSNPAMLEVFDASGRRLMSREVGTLGPGRHQIRLDEAASPRAGLYLVRLRQSGRALTARAVVLR